MRSGPETGRCHGGSLEAGQSQSSSTGRGRCPPCLLSRRSRRISTRLKPAEPSRARASPRATSIPPTARPVRISGRTNGWWTSFTSVTWPIPVRWTWPGGTSSPTTRRPPARVAATAARRPRPPTARPPRTAPPRPPRPAARPPRPRPRRPGLPPDRGPRPPQATRPQPLPPHPLPPHPRAARPSRPRPRRPSPAAGSRPPRPSPRRPGRPAPPRRPPAPSGCAARPPGPPSTWRPA